MNYIDIKSSIKSGDLLVWSHRKWSSFYDLQLQLVRFGTQSEYCHVGIAWVINNRVFVIESVVPQVRIFPLSQLIPFYWVDIKQNYWTPEIEEYALSLVGKEYSKWEAFRSAFKYFTPGANDVWECAELCNAIMKKGGVISDDIKSTPALIVQEVLDKNAALMYVNQ